MLTISEPLSPSQAQPYNSREFSTVEQAYYAQSGEIRGEWRGQPAEEWGFQGDVTEEQFQRAGWDATFSVPKTVSLSALVGGDERVREADPARVNSAVDELGQYVQACIG